ncbi:hypothetical protein BS47DRAFT_1358205 [Hydnum rufescens UP504]|uniref:Uncharacterized protein n=1 Tax=Hydnum rufescens UP504 TaxID=1448309 RepID=A0A9P6DYC0_9AGAM|nr:hypothetical protein BS47DRAFT_1358205 [Hydnum rufescens UP504]
MAAAALAYWPLSPSYPFWLLPCSRSALIRITITWQEPSSRTINSLFPSEPVQARLAFPIVRADDVVLKGLAVVEFKFPCPFQTPTGESQTPAYGIAQNADKSLSPIVDQLELAVNKLHPGGVTPTSDVSPPKSQIHRAYKLSLDLKDQLYALSGEQIKQIQQHNLVVQKVTQTVYKPNDSQGPATGLPSHVQSSVKPLQNQLAQALKGLQTVIQSGGSASQKATQVAAAVQHQIGPVLEAFKETAGKLTGLIRVQPTQGNGTTNGSS